jgi:pimeloyl-ACP methyl ester carboxylesterase
VKVHANGVDLFFDVEGTQLVADGPWMRERPTVVLLPTGPGLDHSLYKDHVGPMLAEDAQVVYVDQRGSGRSDWSSEEHWTLETWVADLAAFYDALELERPILFGTGVGGMVALLYAARHPDRVARLVLVSTVARYIHTRVIAEFDRLGGHHAGEVAARYFADPTEASFAEYMRVCVPLYTRRSLPPDVVARIAMNSAQAASWDRSGERDFDLRDEAANVGCPTLVLAGADDPGAALVGVEELVAALPQELVRFERFENVGHGVFRDRPETMSLVREFLFASAPEPA